MVMPMRLHARFPCRLKALLHVPGRKEPLQVQVRNIGMGGALIAARGRLADKGLQLQLTGPGESLVLDASIARRCGGDAEDPSLEDYALAFTIPFSEKHKLLKLVDRVRMGSGR